MRWSGSLCFFSLTPQQVACLKPSLRTLAGSLSRPFRESKSSVFLTDLQEGQLEAQ